MNTPQVVGRGKFETFQCRRRLPPQFRMRMHRVTSPLKVTRRSTSVVPGVDEIVVGQDGRVGVADQEDSSAAEILKEAIKRPNSHSLPPSSRALPPAHSAVTHLHDVPPFGVVRLLDDGGALAPVPDLAPEAERLDLQVLVPRPRKHAASALQEVPHLQRVRERVREEGLLTVRTRAQASSYSSCRFTRDDH